MNWFTALLIASCTLHASMTVVRPMLTYRALELGVDTAFLGLIAAMFALAPVLVAVPLGRLVDRGHESRFALAGTVAIIVAAFALAASPSMLTLILCSPALGLGHLAIIVAMQGLIASASSPDRYDRRYAHLGLAAAFGQLIGPALGGFVAGEGSPSGVASAMAVSGLLGIVAIPFLIVMRAGDRSVDRTATTARPRVPVGTILRTPGMPAAMLASLTVGSAVDVLMVYLPAFGEGVGWTPTQVGILLAIRAASSMASRFVIGPLADRFGRRGLLAGSMVGAALAFLVLPVTDGFGPAVIVMIAAGFALGLGQPLTIAWVATRAEVGTQATALSVRIMGNRVGQVAVPLAAGLVAGVTGVAGVLAMTGIAVGLSTVAVVAGSGDRRPVVPVDGVSG